MAGKSAAILGSTREELQLERVRYQPTTNVQGPMRTSANDSKGTIHKYDLWPGVTTKVPKMIADQLERKMRREVQRTRHVPDGTNIESRMTSGQNPATKEDGHLVSNQVLYEKPGGYYIEFLDRN